MKRLLFVLCSLVAVQEVCARRPAVRFDLPYTVEHGKYVVVLGTPAGPRRFIFDTGASAPASANRCAANWVPRP